jgi:hypothetical protein
MPGSDPRLLTYHSTCTFASYYFDSSSLLALAFLSAGGNKNGSSAYQGYGIKTIFFSKYPELIERCILLEALLFT